MKLPIKKKYKKYNRNGLDRGNNIRGLYSGPVNYSLAYGRTPLIDPTLPNDNPANIRAAIALQRGWIEMPISAIDLDANLEWEENILAARLKYGDSATYIVDPNTSKIIPQSVFNELITNTAFSNSSENILNNNTAFLVLQHKNHEDLQDRDPLKLGTALMVAGAAPFVLGPAVAAAAPAMPYIKPVLTAINVGYGGYNAARAINDVALGDYEGAAIHGGLAASTMIPTGVFSNLSLWPKVGATLGYGAGTSALTYADTQRSNNQMELEIADLATKKDYIINDAEEQKILQYLSDLGYDTSRFNVRKYAGSDRYTYEITSGNGNENFDLTEPVSNWFSDRGNRMWTYFGTKYGTKYGIVPTYKFIVGKQIKRPGWLQKVVNRVPPSWKSGARKFVGTTWSDLLYLGLEGLASLYERDQTTSNLTDSLKTGVANALILLGTKYPELLFYNISPELLTGYKLTDIKDTTDYIPGLPEIVNDLSQLTQLLQLTEVEDTAITNNAPIEY